MALIDTIDQDGKTHRAIVSPDKANKVYMVLSNRKEPVDSKQEAYVATIKGLHIGWRNASQEYLDDHWDELLPAILSTWRVDEQGNYVAPGDKHSYNFALKHRLWEHGRMAPSVKAFNKLSDFTNKPIPERAEA